MPEEQIIRDRSSGRIHRRVRLGDGWASLEADNLDQAGAFDVNTVPLDEIDPADLCERCFPAAPTATEITEE